MVERRQSLIRTGKMRHRDALMAIKADAEFWNALTPELQTKVNDTILRFYSSGYLSLPYVMKAAIEVENECIEQEYQVRLKDSERVSRIVNMELDLDYENLFESAEEVEGIHADSLSDGLILSLTNLGRVDIEYISKITDNTLQDVISGLKGSIFQDPFLFEECFYKGWVSKDEYLSGNVYKKYKEAKEANIKYPGLFDDNVRELRRVMPDKLKYEDIYVTLGSPWVPTDLVARFISLLLNASNIAVTHDPITGSWQIVGIESKNSYFAKAKYGTNRINAYDIIESTLNGREVVVKDKLPESMWTVGPNGKKKPKYKINRDETNLALEKQKNIISMFQEWIWSDEKRKKYLVNLYFSKYGCLRKRYYDGSFLTFPGLSPDVTLFDYQKDAVARIIFSPNTLLAHDVGSGKTYEMIAAGMEMRRMKISAKNLYVVPNNIIDQWETIFKSMYPNANILKVSPKNFTPAKRKEILQLITWCDFDAIIMAHSSFDLIETSKKFKIQEIQDDINKLEALQPNERTTNTKIRMNALKKRLDLLMSEEEGLDETIYFDELGITRLFVDEAHYYKNVPFDTKMGSVSGLNPQGSDKCKSMLEKVRVVQSKNNGKGVIFATGTPITNSISDCYIMQTYLQAGELVEAEIDSFDSWALMFAEVVHEFEVDVDTTKFRIGTRFGKFHNLPELTRLLSSIADFHRTNESASLPEFDGYTDVTVEKSRDFALFLEEISKRADRVRNKEVDPTEDNMLMITTDGRKGALDLRIIDESKYGYIYRSKSMECARRVAQIYNETIADKSTQLIFSDISTPNPGHFNVYDEIKSDLIVMGVAEDEIAFIHDYDTEAKRNRLFKAVNKGEVRVLFGSTMKLGLGVNVQERLIAIHHIDVPWRPADMVQREGRIIRPGNTNPRIYIYRYITEHSFDAYSWQLLESKQNFISKLLSNEIDERIADDIDDSVLNYAEVKALAIGNPLIKERVEAYNNLQRFKNLEHKAKEKLDIAKAKVKDYEDAIPKRKEVYEHTLLDIDFLTTHTFEYTKEYKKAHREEVYKKLVVAIANKSREKIGDYMGFEIYSPGYCPNDKCYIYLKRENEYRLEVARTAQGILVRIENFLEKLSDYANSISKEIGVMENYIIEATKEIKNGVSYSKQIAFWSKRLNDIDDQLELEE